MEFILILRLLLYFIIYSFFGWILESVFKSVLQKKIVNSGFLYGPFCPIYGFGAVIMLLFLEPFKQNIVVLFFVSFLVMSIWEYIVGWFLEKKFNTKYWDYTNNFLNIKGRVCVQNSTFWGILGVAFMMLIHPCTMKYIEMLNKQDLIYINCILSIVMLIDTIITVVKMKTFDSTLESIKDLGETIKLKLKEIKELKDVTPETLKTMEIKIEELKRRQELLRLRLYRYVKRLKKAFPTIKSDSITQFLNQKIDFKSLKEKIKDKIDK